MNLLKINLNSENNKINDDTDLAYFEDFIEPLLPLITNYLSNSLHIINGSFQAEQIPVNQTYLYTALVRIFFFETNRQYTLVSSNTDIDKLNLPWYCYEQSPDNDLESLTDNYLEVLLEAVQTCYSFAQIAIVDPIFNIEEHPNLAYALSTIERAYFRLRIDFLISGEYLPSEIQNDNDFRENQWTSAGISSSYLDYSVLNLSLFTSGEIARNTGLNNDSLQRRLRNKQNKNLSKLQRRTIQAINNFNLLIEEGIQQDLSEEIYVDGIVAADEIITAQKSNYEPTSYLSKGFSQSVPPYGLDCENETPALNVLIRELKKYKVLNGAHLYNEIAEKSALTTKLVKQYIDGESKSLFLHQAVRLNHALSLILNLNGTGPFTFYNFFKRYHSKSPQ